MKKVLSVILILAIIFIMLPVQSFAANDKVEICGCRISAGAKQVCFVGGETKGFAEVLKNFFAPGFGKFYYAGEDILDFKEIAEKLPELQNLVVITCDVQNVSAIADMKNLVWLSLYGNNGNSSLSFLKNTTGLKKFSYSNSGCKNIKPVAYLKNLTELNISLDYENMPDLSPIKGLTKLKKLEVTGSFEDLSAVKNMKNLRSLKAVSAELTDLSALQELPKLTELYLEKCDLIQGSEIAPLKNLTVFSMDSVGMDDADSTASLKKLKSFSLSNVDCDSVYYLDELPKLEELYFKNITAPDLEESVAGLTSLKKLTVAGCGLKSCGFAKNLTGLEELDLSDNKISSITPLSKLTKLKFLDLCSNKIEDISAVANMKQLTELGLSYNEKISDLSPMSRLTELKKFYVYQNSIKDISPLKSLTKLEFLNIGRASSTSSAVKGQRAVLEMTELKTLIIDGTGFTEKNIADFKRKNPKCEVFEGSDDIWDLIAVLERDQQ